MHTAMAGQVRNDPALPGCGRGRAACHAGKEGIVVVYSDDHPGREFLEQARSSLSEVDVVRATEMGRRLTIYQALELARIADAAPAEPHTP